jgi:hypothetical protein
MGFDRSAAAYSGRVATANRQRQKSSFMGWVGMLSQRTHAAKLEFRMSSNMRKTADEPIVMIKVHLSRL